MSIRAVCGEKRAVSRTMALTGWISPHSGLNDSSGLYLLIASLRAIRRCLCKEL
ncbi:unnamed protein product [Ectocarpus sp. CCAP 1310/34]|nr:unnamed protein product [Ectocarpus sp. CCAP 1310/34]